MRDEETISIGEVAAASGLRPSALRFYEREGLIASAERRGGRRYYDRNVVSRLAFIALCQDAGFTLGQIHELLNGAQARERWHRLATEKVAELDDRLARLRTMRERLQAALNCGCADIEHCGLVAEAARRRREGG